MHIYSQIKVGKELNRIYLDLIGKMAINYMRIIAILKLIQIRMIMDIFMREVKVIHFKRKKLKS